MTAELDAKRARLATVEGELAELGAGHDLAMSAFKFDEARKAQERITVLERGMRRASGSTSRRNTAARRRAGAGHDPAAAADATPPLA